MSAGCLELHCPLQVMRNDCSSGVLYAARRLWHPLQHTSTLNYLFYPALKTDARPTSLNTNSLLLAPDSALWLPAHCRYLRIALHTALRSDCTPRRTVCSTHLLIHSLCWSSATWCKLVLACVWIICLLHCLILMTQERSRSFLQWPAACSKHCFLV